MLAFIVILAVIVLDQLTKYLVTQFIPLGTEVDFIPWFINLTHIENDGASFGMFSEHRWIFMILSTVAIITMIAFMFLYKKQHVLLTIGLAFILGGGIGNMIDRVFRYTVVDFFEFTFVDFAIFNVADMFITFGAVVLGVYLIFFDKKHNALTKGITTEKDDTVVNAAVVEKDSKSDDNTNAPA